MTGTLLLVLQIQTPMLAERSLDSRQHCPLGMQPDSRKSRTTPAGFIFRKVSGLRMLIVIVIVTEVGAVLAYQSV